LRQLAVSLLGSLCLFFALAGCAGLFAPTKQPVRLKEVSFSTLDGWATGDPRAALAAFARSCATRATRPDAEALGGAGYGGKVADWRAACAQSAQSDAAAAREFFESRFVPYRVASGREEEGLFTGYYEPLLHGSRKLHDRYRTPLYGMPTDLVVADLGLFRDSLKDQHLVGRVEKGRFIPYLTRAEIARRGVPAKPLVYVDDPIDAFFLQVQGSGRVELDDGSIMRAVYAGQNGQPYTAIGKVLIEKGSLTRDSASMQSIRDWLAAHPDEMQSALDADASYVFFAEKPVGDAALGAEGAEGVPLTPLASLAVDRNIHALGVPVWVEATAPDPDATKPDVPFHRLFVMQDTGGAITGAVRGDVYWGYGPEPAAIAGRMKNSGHMTILLPKVIAARLGTDAEFPKP
jgi:membrane-bound lytic murein transglycosylase A